MKRCTFILASFLVLAACSPETFTMNIEMRHPSRSGMDLARKTMAVVYADNGVARDTMFLRNVATGFAERMEEDYFGGQEMITLYTTPADTVLSSRERLQQLVMDTGSDVIFLFDVPEFGNLSLGETAIRMQGARSADSAYVNQVALPFKLKLHVYDSMNKDDKVYSFNGTSAIKAPVYHGGEVRSEVLESLLWKDMPALAAEVGGKSTANFVSTWVPEQYSLYYYEDLSEDWEAPSQAAYEYKWTDAIKLWTGLIGKFKSPEKRACAAYDIATACYMVGKYDLALRWLDRADEECALALSPGLRKRIQERMK